MGPSRSSKYDEMFQEIVEEYAMRSGNVARRYGIGRGAAEEREDDDEANIEIHTYDMLRYASMDSLRKLIGRVLGRNLPKDIEGFLRQILHTERYWISRCGDEREIEMACTNFIDSTVIERCRAWLEEHECAEKLFSRIEIGNVDRSGSSKLSNEDGLESFKGEIESLVPFDCEWRVRDVDEIFKISREGAMPPMPSLLSFDSAEGSVGGSSLKFRQRRRGKPAPVEGKETQERPFVCAECGCAFKRQEHRNRHEKMHTGERPFKCPFPGCSRAFSRSDNMNSHYKTHSVAERKKFYRFEDLSRNDAMRRREELRRRKSVRKNMESY